MTTKQYLQLQDIYAENCDASGNIATVYPALGLGVRGNYEIAILNASALQTEGVDSWMFAIGQDFDADTHILYENTNVSYAVNGTSGLFTVSGMQGTRTDDMLEWIGDQEAPTVVGELIGMGSDHNKNKPVSLVQWRMFMRNRVDWDSEDEPSVVPNYATTDDLARLVYTKTIIEDEQFVLDEEDGDSIKDVARPELPDWAFLTIPAKLDAIKVENDDAYDLIGISGVSAEFNTSVQTPFNLVVRLDRNEESEEGTAEYLASGSYVLETLGGNPNLGSDYYNFILTGPENGTVIDGDDEAQWMLKVESKHTSGAEFVEALRYYAPRKTETNNLLIPVSGGEFTGDIFKKEFNEDFFYHTANDVNWRIIKIAGGVQNIYSAQKCDFFKPYFTDEDILQCSGYGRHSRMPMKNGGVMTVYIPYDDVYFTRIPNTDNFECVMSGEGAGFWQKFVLEKNGSDYLWRSYYATLIDDRQWEEDTTSPPMVLSGFDPFKNTPYAHTSGGVFENGIYDGRKSGTPISYYVTERLEGASASIYTSIGSRYDMLLLVPSSINVEMNDEAAILFDGVEIEYEGRNKVGPSYTQNVNLRKVDEGAFTASGHSNVDYFYSLNLDANGASLAVTYASAGQIYQLTTLYGATEERETPTYIPYATNGEFEYDTKTWEYTSDSGTITIYDNPLDNPDFIRAKVKLIVRGAEKYWEGRITKQTAGIYSLGSFSYEGTTIYLIVVTITNYIIAYDGQPGGTEEAEWTLPAEFGFNRFIPTSGGTFTGAISASDGNPYTTSGQYEEMIQSRIDNPELAGDNYSASYNMPITDDFLPFPGNPETIRGLYGPLNQSSIGTVATKELIISSSYGNIDWHDGDWLNFNWFHKPVTVNDGAEHNYYITVRLNIVSTDPYELASDGSLWTLDCWKID